MAKAYLLLIVVALNSAVSRAAPADTLGKVDACALLRHEDISEALGVRVIYQRRDDAGEIASPIDGSPSAYSSTCFWSVDARRPGDDHAGADGATARYVILLAMQWPKGKNLAAGFLQNFRDAARAGEISRVPVELKIASGAVWWGDGVAAYQGNLSYGVSVHVGLPKEAQRKAEEHLARVIASRL